MMEFQRENMADTTPWTDEIGDGQMHSDGNFRDDAGASSPPQATHSYQQHSSPQGEARSQAPTRASVLGKRGNRLRLCDFWSRNGNCLHGEGCKFFHDPTITPRPLQDSRSTRSGEFEQRTGKDKEMRSDKQQQQHQQQQHVHQRSPTSAIAPNQPGGAPRRVCDFFSKYGNCRAGRSCKFLHVTPPFVQQHLTQQLCLQKQQHPVSVGLLDVATGSSSLSRTGHSPLNALAAAQATIGFYLSDTNSIDSFPQTCGWNNEMDAVLEDWRDPMQGRDWESEDGMSGGWQPPRQSSVAYGCVGVEEEPNVGINLTGGGFVSGGLQRSRQVCTDGGKGCVVGGGPSASPQFQKGVNSRAKWAVGQDGTAWFLTGDGWAHNAAGVRRRVCDFFDAKGNCRHGSACGFLHIGRDTLVHGDEDTVMDVHTTSQIDSISSVGKGMGMHESGIGKGLESIGGANIMNTMRMGLSSMQMAMGTEMCTKEKGSWINTNAGMGMIAQGMQYPIIQGASSMQASKQMLMGNIQGMNNIGMGMGVYGMGMGDSVVSQEEKIKMLQARTANSNNASSLDYHAALRASLEGRLGSGSPNRMRSDSPLAMLPMNSPRPDFRLDSTSAVKPFDNNCLSSCMGHSSAGSASSHSSVLSRNSSPRGMMDEISRANSPRPQPLQDLERSGSSPLKGRGLAVVGGSFNGGPFHLKRQGMQIACTSSQAAALWGDREGEVGRLADYLKSSQMIDT